MSCSVKLKFPELLWARSMLDFSPGSAPVYVAKSFRVGFDFDQCSVRLMARLTTMLLATAGLALFPKAIAATAKPSIEFNRDIRPILSENCFACHGPDKNKRKAGLRLDRKEEATSKLESDDRAIVPGDVEKSKLLKLVTTTDEDDRMPPKKTGKHLTRAQIDLLRDWIAQGAPWQEHWSYIPPKKAPLPETKIKDWAQNEIDSFVLQRLEKEGLKPSPKAEKQTLIRRVTLDLTG